jgi:hypothetical protein
MPPPKPSQETIDLGLRYFRGDLRTAPIQEQFRSSRESDVQPVWKIPAADRARFVQRALSSIRAGEGIFGALAAGGSMRMNPADAPEVLKPLIQRLYGEDRALESKAAVPLGLHDGRVYTFLGLFLSNVSRLLSAVGGKAAASSRVLIFTNDRYAEELESELQLQDRYGYLGILLTPRQELGYAFVAKESDVAKVKEKLGPDRYERALELSRQAADAIFKGQSESVLLKNEPVPLGHGEFFHQLVSSGLLRELVKQKVRWISLRNIDNSAATFDQDWLVSLGMFLEDDLDFQTEVSPRAKGQKGGALIVGENGTHRLAEDPAFEATWLATLDHFMAKGYRREETPTSEQALRNRFLSEGQLRFNYASPDLPPGEESSLERSLSDLRAGRLLRLTSGESGLWLRAVLSEDSYWFNNATGIFRPEYLCGIYAKEGHSTGDFIHEMEGASSEELQAIAERGRRRFPTLVDVKPARFSDAVAAKAETNLWQSTGIARRAKIRSVGVLSAAGMNPAEYRSLPEAERRRLMRHLRMLPTKQWTGSAESYDANRAFIEDLIPYILESNLLSD